MSVHERHSPHRIQRVYMPPIRPLTHAAAPSAFSAFIVGLLLASLAMFLLGALIWLLMVH